MRSFLQASTRLRCSALAPLFAAWRTSNPWRTQHEGGVYEAKGELMLVKRYMQTKVVMVGLEERANAALYMMKKKGIRHLLVTDNGKLRGIVTDRDFRLMRPSPATSLSIYEVHYLLDKLTVKEIMTKKPIAVMPETPIAEAARLLLNRRIGALPVLKDEKVVGIITETDMIRALIDLEEAS